MAFGQVSGPPATARRVAELAALLEERGYESFREARHPFGLTQRQAGGKFTTAEVDVLIGRIEAGADDAPSKAPAAAAPPDAQADRRRTKRDEEVAVRLGADVMATELTNRGWCCIPPD